LTLETQKMSFLNTARSQVVNYSSCSPHLWPLSLKFACSINRLGISLCNYEWWSVNNGGDRVQWGKCSFQLLYTICWQVICVKWCIYWKENGLIFPGECTRYETYTEISANNVRSIQQPTYCLVQRARYTYITMQIRTDDFSKFLTKSYH
jgi:hypothetical protein